MIDQNTIFKVLVVEDDPDLQSAYTMILQSQGYHVESAGDGLDGLQKLTEYTPDLILLDYFMPRMDGKTFLQNFNSEQFPHTKVIVASNVSDRHVLDELLELGADKAILKADLSPSELLELIDEFTVSE